MIKKRSNISIAIEKRWKNPTKKMLDGQRRRALKAAKRRWGTKAKRKAHSLLMKKKWKNPTKAMLEGKKKGGETFRLRFTAKKRKAHSERVRNRWKHPTKAMIDGARRRGELPAKDQKRFARMLSRNRIKGFILEFRITGPHEYWLDVAFPELKLCVEIDGTWHDQVKVKKKDAIRDRYLRSLGWKVFRVGTSREELLRGLRWVQEQMKRR